MRPSVKSVQSAAHSDFLERWHGTNEKPVIDLNDPLSRWFPQIEKSEQISLRHLLNHRLALGVLQSGLYAPRTNCREDCRDQFRHARCQTNRATARVAQIVCA